MRNDPSSDFLTLHEIVRAARKKLEKGSWDYLVGGTETETTLKRNRQSIDCMAFKPRVLRDVSTVDTSGTLLGKTLRMPVLLAPIGSVENFHPEGGAASAQAAEAAGICHMLSSRCNPGLEETAKAADNHRIFQLYVRGDWSFVDDHARRARDNGYYAFCVTVDSAHYSRRERDIVGRFVKPWRAAASGLDHQAAYAWDDVKRFRDAYPDYPLILKGIGTAEDAALCLREGVEGVYVSNHGGRQLDHGFGSFEVLREVAEVVGDKAEVIVDGCFYRGSDIVKAIALGAKCVGLGRMQAWGLAAGGVPGLLRALELLELEMRTTMQLLGVTSLDQLDSSYLVEAEPVTDPFVASAFPLLEWEHDAY